MNREDEALPRRLAEAQAWWELRQRSNDPEIALSPPVERPSPLPDWIGAPFEERQQYLVRLSAWELRDEQRLRSYALDPAPNHAEWRLPPDWKDSGKGAALVEAVCTRRAELLQQHGAYPAGPASGKQATHVVVFNAAETDIGGAEEVGSCGFFTYAGEPPWDFWLAVVPDKFGNVALLSFVPPELVHNVDGGVWASPTACVRWATDEELRLFSSP